MSRFRNLVCLLLTVLAGLTAGAQQITGSIRGSVEDPSGAVVQSANVTARQTETGLARTAMTDHTGAYVLVELPVGHYELQVEARGSRSTFSRALS